MNRTPPNARLTAAVVLMARKAGLPRHRQHALGLRAAEAEKEDQVAAYRAADPDCEILFWETW